MSITEQNKISSWMEFAGLSAVATGRRGVASPLPGPASSLRCDLGGVHHGDTRRVSSGSEGTPHGNGRGGCVACPSVRGGTLFS